MPMPRGFKHSEETKNKMKESRKGHPPTHTQKHSEETKAKMRETRKNVSADTRLKLSKAGLGRKSTQIMTGDKNPHWKGGKGYTINGYIMIYKPDYPTANKHNYILEHRFIMETIIGRHLKDEEEVHHINGIKHDNRPENLILFPNASEHTKYHQKHNPIIRTRNKDTGLFMKQS